jgi:hypothetical protein
VAVYQGGDSTSMSGATLVAWASPVGTTAPNASWDWVTTTTLSGSLTFTAGYLWLAFAPVSTNAAYGVFPGVSNYGDFEDITGTSIRTRQAAIADFPLDSPPATWSGSLSNESAAPINGYITYTAGASVAIDSVSDATYTNGQTGIVITGSGFGASQGAGVVLISPTDDVTDVDAEAQTVTAWGDTSITFTAVRGSLAYNTTMYLFVKEDGGTSNAAGEPVSFYDPAAGLVILPRRTTFVNDIIIQY